MREQIARANRESANPKNSPLEHSQASAPRRTAPHRAAPRRIADSFDKMPTAGCGNLHLKTINHIRARDGETGAISVSRSSRRIPLPVAPRKRAARNCRFVVSSVAAGDTQRIPQLCACAREGERQRVKERERKPTGVRGRNGCPISSRYRSDLTAARYRKPRSWLFRARRITRPAKYADLPSSVTTQGPPRRYRVI